MDLIRSNQCRKPIESKHRGMGLNMKYCENQSQVQSEQKARQVRVIHRV